MSNTLVKSATIILVVTFAGRLLGLFRETLVASTYGLSYQADVYNWVFGIILTLYMVIPGAINAVYVPVMSKFVTTNDVARRNQLFRGVFTVILLSFIGFTILLYLFTPQIISFLQPGYDERSMILGIQLFRIALPAMFIIGLLGLLMSVSYSHKQFFIPSIGTVIFSVSVIVTILFFVPQYGIQGLMVGTTIGYLIFGVLLIIATKRKKYSFSLRFEAANDRDLKRMGQLFVPILIGSAMSQSYFYVNQFLASTLAEGSQSALIYAQKLYQLPTAIFVGAFTIPLLPILSELVKKNEMEEMKRIVRKGSAYLHLLMLPTTVAFVVIGDLFIRLVFERGLFTAADTMETYKALFFFSFAIFPMALNDLLVRSYYAMENTKTPVILAFIAVLVNLVVAVALMPILQHGAMAVGYSVAMTTQILLMVYFLRRKIGSIYNQEYMVSFAKAVVASVLMGVVLWGMRSIVGSVAVYVTVPLYIAVGALCYYIVLVIMREAQVAEMKEMVMRKIKR